jgi:hypothetical protein
MGSDEEVVEDDEVVGEEEEKVDAEEEPVEDSEEVAGDEVAVGAPNVADPVYAYILGVSKVPDGLGEWDFLDLLSELRKAEALGFTDRAKRIRRLVWLFCPLKPNKCPFYSFTARCPVKMEKSCRAFAFAKKGQRGRGWYKK